MPFPRRLRHMQCVILALEMTPTALCWMVSLCLFFFCECCIAFSFGAFLFWGAALSFALVFIRLSSQIATLLALRRVTTWLSLIFGRFANKPTKFLKMFATGGLNKEAFCSGFHQIGPPGCLLLTLIFMLSFPVRFCVRFKSQQSLPPRTLAHLSKTWPPSPWRYPSRRK